MPNSRWIALALCGLLAAALAGTPASAQKAGGTLVQITQPEPPNLAPYISTSAPIGQVTAKVYDGLLEYGFDLKPKPGRRPHAHNCSLPCASFPASRRLFVFWPCCCPPTSRTNRARRPKMSVLSSACWLEFPPRVCCWRFGAD